MTATQRFIEDAIKGGWMPVMNEWEFRKMLVPTPQGESDLAWVITYNIFLDPLAWQAVGKVRGWNANNEVLPDATTELTWENQWHRFIDHLADGKTIEEALLAIENV